MREKTQLEEYFEARDLLTTLSWIEAQLRSNFLPRKRSKSEIIPNVLTNKDGSRVAQKHIEALLTVLSTEVGAPLRERLTAMGVVDEADDVG